MIETIEPHPHVQAQLAESGVQHVVRRHADCPFPVRSPDDFARCLGRPLDCIAKSLLVEMADAEQPARYAVAVAPIPTRINFGILARHWNVQKVRMASAAELAARLNYPPTGVSPLGCGDLPVVIDDSVFGHETVMVGGGAAGVEIEIAPEDLRRVVGATRMAIATR